MKGRLKHLVVVLPGITGSVLSKDGRDLWAFSPTAIVDALFARTGYLDDLRLKAPDDGSPDLGDGVEATALMPNAMLIPGLVKLFAGYTDIASMVRNRFEVAGSGLASAEPTNLIEIPYDWRRDNRVSARKVGAIIDDRLAAWRALTGDKNAKSIILAHSMGGLVARYYLEVLEGWSRCLALITLGTPYRGSVNALNFLEHGYSAATVDLTGCLRSFDSVYQLLPTYPVVRSPAGCHAVSAADGLAHVERARAQAAARFHEEIAAAVERHRQNPAYLTGGYKVLPFVGTRQPTLQSATLESGVLTVENTLPPGVDELLDAGDGTVPRYAAVPPELDQEFRETFIPEKHGALQASRIVLDDLVGRLEQMQVGRAIRGPELQAEGAAISLAVDDLLPSGEPIELNARLMNIEDDAGGLLARVWPVESDERSAVTTPFHRENDAWKASLGRLPQAMYRVEVRARRDYPAGPAPVHDLFQVA